MQITSVNKLYFQKSKVFIYPILGIRKGQSISLIETYIGWKDKNIHHSDNKLACLFHLRNDKEFKDFMKKRLFANPYFQEFYELEDEKAIFVFDLREFKNDWKHFLEGNYSKFSQRLKNIIVNHQQRGTANFSYVNSFVYPDKYFGIYKDLLQVDIALLQSVGELCDKPDLEKEVLIAKIKNLNLEKTQN